MKVSFKDFHFRWERRWFLCRFFWPLVCWYVFVSSLCWMYKKSQELPRRIFKKRTNLRNTFLCSCTSNATDPRTNMYLPKFGKDILLTQLLRGTERRRRGEREKERKRERERKRKKERERESEPLMRLSIFLPPCSSYSRLVHRNVHIKTQNVNNVIFQIAHHVASVARIVVTRKLWSVPFFLSCEHYVSQIALFR